MPILEAGRIRPVKALLDEEDEVVPEVDVVVEVDEAEVRPSSFIFCRQAHISEPFRGGGRGGRGGIRGGRGGYTGTNGSATHANGNGETTETTTEGWAAQVEQATSAEVEPSQEAESSTQAAAAGKGDDFAAAGGWGDAPSAKEIQKAAKSGNSGWQGKGKQAVSAVNTAAPAPAGPPKLTWAQIAK